MATAFLFPGQGSQEPKMLEDLPSVSVVKDTIEEANEILGKSVYEYNTKKAMKSTKAVQISLFVTEVAAFRLFLSNGGKPDYVAGHSVGAFAAAVAAGVIRYEEGLKLVMLRGEAMETIHPEGFGMAVVLGMDINRLQSIVDEIYLDSQQVYVSNVNAHGQITISGSIQGLELSIEQALREGAQCASMLNVNTPSHCPLLLPVSEKLKEAFAEIDMKQPVIPYAGNRRARILSNREEIKNDLILSVAYPVRWHEAT